MIENCIGKLSLPMGLGLNFIINGKPYAIPMVTEEPSVIGNIQFQLQKYFLFVLKDLSSNSTFRGVSVRVLSFMFSD
jgi:hypothetical protein